MDYFPHAKENRVGFTLGSAQADYRFTIRITGGSEHLEYIACCPFRIRKKLRSSTAELITRANYCMPLGKFEMDMADGEVRFHLTHVIGELGLTSEMIERHFMTAYFTMDRYFPAFMQHIHAGYTPEDAVFHAELDYNAERVEETPKPAPKAKEKAKPASSSDASSAQPVTAASDAGSLPPSSDPRQESTNPPAPSSKKPHRGKSGEGASGQGELPLY